MIANCHSIEVLKETYFDWIFFFIMLAVIIFWRSRYCYLSIQFKGSQNFSSHTIRAKSKNIKNELNELKALKDINIF
jgi:preprotein translocase subunit SecF